MSPVVVVRRARWRDGSLAPGWAWTTPTRLGFADSQPEALGAALSALAASRAVLLPERASGAHGPRWRPWRRHSR